MGSADLMGSYGSSSGSGIAGLTEGNSRFRDRGARVATTELEAMTAARNRRGLTAGRTIADRIDGVATTVGREGTTEGGEAMTVGREATTEGPGARATEEGEATTECPGDKEGTKEAPGAAATNVRGREMPRRGSTLVLIFQL